MKFVLKYRAKWLKHVRFSNICILLSKINARCANKAREFSNNATSSSNISNDLLINFMPYKCTKKLQQGSHPLAVVPENHLFSACITTVTLNKSPSTAISS